MEMEEFAESVRQCARPMVRPMVASVPLAAGGAGRVLRRSKLAPVVSSAGSVLQPDEPDLQPDQPDLQPDPESAVDEEQVRQSWEADDTESEEEKGGASERTPAARELGTGELGTARVVLAADTSRQPKSTVNGMTVVNSGSAGGDSAVGSRQGHQDSRYNF
jgi:hypothetical protein